MHLICVSASNILHAHDCSTSLKICHLIQKIVAENLKSSPLIDIITLIDYELKPCIGCGTCFTQGTCMHDPVFNGLYTRLTGADGIFVISAHYTPIPAKLCMLLEKIEQLAFLPRFHDDMKHSPLYRLPVGIIGHGGGTEDIIEAYKSIVLDTIANALSWPVEMKIVKCGQDNGVVVPVRNVRHSLDSIFPVQEYDWDDIEHRIRPLVNSVLDCIKR
jgi:hypothetical protein